MFSIIYFIVIPCNVQEVTGQKEPGVMILSEFCSDDVHDDGTRTLVQKFSDNGSQLFQSEEGNEEEHQDVENNPMENIASNTGLDIDDDDEDEITCMICLEPFEIGDKVTWSKQMKCRHIFHHECIYPWLLKNEECPCCRSLYIPRTKYDEIRSDNENSTDQNESESDDEEEWNEEEDDPSSAYFIINGLISRVGEQVRTSIVNSVNLIRSSSFSSSNSQDDDQGHPDSIDTEPNQSSYEQNLSPSNSDDDSMLDGNDDIEKTYSLQELRDDNNSTNRLRFWKMNSSNNNNNRKQKTVRRLDSCNYNSIRTSSEATHPDTCAVDVSEVEMGIVSENSSTALNQIFRISPRNSFSSNRNKTSLNTSKNIQ